MLLGVPKTVFVAARKHASDDSNPFAVERYGETQNDDDEESVMYMLLSSFSFYCHTTLFSSHSSFADKWADEKIEGETQAPAVVWSRAPRGLQK
jgi:hypothetical protein